MKNTFKLAPTTLGKIREFEPCKEGWKTLCTALGTSGLDTEVTIEQILETNGVKDAFWALRTQDERLQRLIAADVAESVLHIFEEKYPEDKRPRECIEVTKKWCYGGATNEELVAALRAAGAAYDAAAWAAWAAAAYGAGAGAAYGAGAGAAWRAAYDAAGAAYAAAARDAWAAWAAAEQWKKNEEILRGYML